MSSESAGLQRDSKPQSCRNGVNHQHLFDVLKLRIYVNGVCVLLSLCLPHTPPSHWLNFPLCGWSILCHYVINI